MIHKYCFLAIGICIGLVGRTWAGDPAKLEHTLHREPTYATKQPLYCLLVFGPEAKTRVWVVLDGNVLYLDRNGNGDLTDPGERITAEELHPDRPDVEVVYRFELTEARDEPIVTCGPEVQCFQVVRFVPRADWHDQAWVKHQREKAYQFSVNTKPSHDQWADFRFATSQKDAPVAHFDGPRRFALSGKFDPPCFRPGESCELAVEMRTHVGDAIVRTGHQAVPEDIHPIAEIEFPPGRPGEAPRRLRVELKERC